MCDGVISTDQRPGATADLERGAEAGVIVAAFPPGVIVAEVNRLAVSGLTRPGIVTREAAAMAGSRV